MRYLITGGNRGIGLEFVRQLLERGDQVEATARAPRSARELQTLLAAHPERLRLHACDVASNGSVVALGHQLAGTPIDVLINNAGVMGTEDSLGGFKFDDFLETLNVNAVGAVRVIQALLPNLRVGGGRKLIQITSGLGSISDNRSGGYLDYRMSKAALDMLAVNLARELGGEGFSSIALQPGWVQTDMGGEGAPTPVETSVGGMLKVIDGLQASDNGRFLGW
ncbi:MAG: SDR family oxidoreductase, partial [Myxococcota bacterium]|nr:SDR family oxidoreductase [Myxococcota bacterium]